jgi:hypothetical protein
MHAHCRLPCCTDPVHSWHKPLCLCFAFCCVHLNNTFKMRETGHVMVQQEFAVHMSCGSQQQDNSTQHNPPSMRAGSCQIIPVCVSTGPQRRDSLQKTETN